LDQITSSVSSIDTQDFLNQLVDKEESGEVNPISLFSVHDILTSRWNRIEDLKDARRMKLGLEMDADGDELLRPKSAMLSQLCPSKRQRGNTLRRTLSINSSLHSANDPGMVPTVGGDDKKRKEKRDFVWGKGIGKGNLLSKKGSAILLPSLNSSPLNINNPMEMIKREQRAKTAGAENGGMRRRRGKKGRARDFMPLTPLSTLYSTSRDRHRAVTMNKEIGWSVRSMVKGADDRRKEEL